MKSYENTPDEKLLPSGMSSDDGGTGGDDSGIAATADVSDELEVLDELEASDDGETGSDDSGVVTVAVVSDELEASDTPIEYEEESSVSEPQRGGFLSSRERLWTAIAFGGVILLAAILRFWGLGDRPLHHDESLHAYFALQVLHDNIENWSLCFSVPNYCYHYNPLTHGPFQFHVIALVYGISQLLHAPDNGVNTTTVRIGAALFGTAMVALPYFLRDYIGKVGAWLAAFLLAVSPGMVYYSRFSREDIYMAFFTLLLVVSAARYVRDRQIRWIIIGSVAFTLSYATKEATFLTVGVFGSFLGMLLAWEIGSRWSLPRTRWTERIPMFSTWAPIALVIYLLVIGIVAKIFLGWIENLSIWVTSSNTNTNIANNYVQRLEANTELVVPWLGILLAVVVIALQLYERYGPVRTSERRGLSRFFNREKYPVLDTILTLPWTHWFFALVIGWFIFLILFSSLFTYLPNGIGEGIWQGLYYWIQQQQVARGGQPWYYYFMLIPLYEQIGVVFGLAGLVYCIMRPTRLRLFLAFWFVGNVFIYTWAGEKMPWLMIHMTLPMYIMAAIALQPAVLALFHTMQAFVARRKQRAQEHSELTPVELASPVLRRPKLTFITSLSTVILAILLLAVTLQNMYQVTFVHYADAPHEMMIYVQTTENVDVIMDKINALDQKLYGGKHEIPIGVTPEATWPFAWYLRDYTDVCYQYPSDCGNAAPSSYPIVISAAEDIATTASLLPDYQMQQYEMRNQWDQGYMPPPCVKTATNPCTDVQQYTGVGPGLWLSYGNNPPPGAQFNLARAAVNIWDWWWYRTPFGGIDVGTQMALSIRGSVVTQTGVHP